MTELADDLLIGVKAAAKFTGLTPRAIYHMVETNRLPFTRKGARLYFRKTELDQAFRASPPV